jgi:hypothetical protein
MANLRPPMVGAHDYVPRPRLQAFMATPGLYASPNLLSGPQQQQQQLLY